MLCMMVHQLAANKNGFMLRRDVCKVVDSIWSKRIRFEVTLSPDDVANLFTITKGMYLTFFFL